MRQAFLTMALLVLSNTFMTLGWYGHLKFRQIRWFNSLGLLSIILICWGVAFYEYFFQFRPIGMDYEESAGNFNLWQLRVIQESLALIIFFFFGIIFFRTENFRSNHLFGFVLLVLAVYFMVKR